MDEARGREMAQGRGPVLYRPEREVIGWMCILATTIGVMTAATHDAYLAGDHGWATLLAGIELTGLITYFQTALWWVNFRKT